jgi:tetratricopeptide (TPR) repeat protein
LVQKRRRRETQEAEIETRGDHSSPEPSAPSGREEATVDSVVRPIGLRDPRFLVASAALALLTGFAYAPVFSNGFVLYDDGLYILNVPQIRRGVSAPNLAWAFTTLQGANWFPLTRISWMLDAELFGAKAVGFHATSLFLHVCATALLFRAFAVMTGALWASAFVAAVFALHPLHVESVAWAAARKDVLSGVFWMLALLAHARVAQRDGKGGAGTARVGVACALLLGLMAKPTLVVLPFVLMLLDIWPLRRIERIGIWGVVREKLPLLAIVVAASALTVFAQRSGGAIPSLDLISLGSRLENAVVATVAYLGKAVWPSGLAVYYPHPLDTLSVVHVSGAIAVCLGLSAAAWAWRRTAPWVAVGWLWFVGALVPVIGIVQVGQAAMADRYTYIPLIGLSLVVAFGLGHLATRPAARLVCGVAAALCVLAMTAATREQVAVWKDTAALFEHALAVTERNHVAHINLAVEHVNAERWGAAEVELRRALKIAPRSAMAHGVLGDALRGQSKPEAALRNYRAALERDPGGARWWTGVGNAQLDSGNAELAVAAYRRALGRESSAQVHGNLGVALLELGRRDEAVASLRAALKIRPNLASARGSLGIALLELGRVAAAIPELQRAIELDGSIVAARAHLALALADRDGPGAGLPAIEGALERDPGNGALHAIAARLTHAAGRPQDAIPRYRDAIARGDTSVDTLNNLAWLLATASPEASPERAEAVELATQAVKASGGLNPGVVDTLAAACAGAGDFECAVASAERALRLAEAAGREALAAEVRSRLESYRARLRAAR